jgi:hypothetical protein
MASSPQTRKPGVDPRDPRGRAEPFGQLEQREPRATAEVQRSTSVQRDVLEEKPPGERGPQRKLVVDFDVLVIRWVECVGVAHG